MLLGVLVLLVLLECEVLVPPLLYIGFRKSSVTQTIPFLSTVTPTPTWVKSWSRMLARCSGLFMNAVWMSETVGPSPTFSPTARQFCTSEVRLGLWYSDCRDAISAECWRAMELRSEATAYGAMPADWRAAFILAMNCASRS